ncbi:MAG TPA: hypothetical protein VGQ99_10870 [Tepidisphaeraceae bacterium]|jgi:Spy/CpxP family protein refolding chaperone|nr:hypothetical protein [Tepidisphaeraceae bacterium]
MSDVKTEHIGNQRIPAALAALLIFLCVAGAAYGIWRWMQKSEVNTDAVAVDPPTRAGGRRGPTADQQFGRVFKRDDGSIRAFSGNYWLTILPQGQSRQMTLHAGNGDEWLNKDQQLVLKLAQRSARGGNALRSLQLTDEQRQQIKLVSLDPSLPLSDQDKSRLEALIKTWESANDTARPEAHKAVLLALREIAKTNLPAGKDAFVASINKLAGMLTPHQLDQYRQIEMARRNGNKPAAPTGGQGA